MQFLNEDGLVFSCKPLSECTFQLAPGACVYSATIMLDKECHVLFGDNELLPCIRRARNFVSKYKIPVKVFMIEGTEDGSVRYSQKFKYTYEEYLAYGRRKEKQKKK